MVTPKAARQAMTVLSTCSPRACHHRAFDTARGDRATSTHTLAMAVAHGRVQRRGRQRVTLHPGPWVRAWFVQDVDETAVRR